MITLITGGSGSGKSAYAEDLITSFGDKERIYIATMYPFDEESRQRVKRHRAMREKKNFHTIECYVGLKDVKIPKGANVLLECMSNLVANEMFRPDGAGEDTAGEVLEGIRNLAAQAGELVIVTNEIFSDGVCYDQETRRYQACLGHINCCLGEQAGQVVEVVYGIPIYLKEKRKEEQHNEAAMEQF